MLQMETTLRVSSTEHRRIGLQNSEFCKKSCNFVAEVLIIRRCRFEYAVNRLFFSAHSCQWFYSIRFV